MRTHGWLSVEVWHLADCHLSPSESPHKGLLGSPLSIASRGKQGVAAAQGRRRLSLWSADGSRLANDVIIDLDDVHERDLCLEMDGRAAGMADDRN
jgi:hypothetical protein